MTSRRRRRASSENEQKFQLNYYTVSTLVYRTYSSVILQYTS